MGSPIGEPGRGDDETLHTVVLSRNIEASSHEVTQLEYRTLMGNNPSYWESDDLPVENVTWYNAVEYCNALSQDQSLTPCYTINGEDVTWNPDADGYRLPTEAEWEYLCRAGTETAFSSGDLTEETCDLDASLDLVGWYCGNADSMTHAVESKDPNADGLYDMHGNVWEWCWDYYGPYEGSVVMDPLGPDTGMQRVRRGGSWFYFARGCRSAERDQFFPNSKDDVIGFRVVRNEP
jgi:formylglycine-generating enzyme required for sulfatase activity